MANVPRSYCPFRSSQTPGALSFCNDECALYIKNSKLPPEELRLLPDGSTGVAEDHHRPAEERAPHCPAHAGPFTR